MFLGLGKRSEMPLAALIPNLLTTLALSCGLASLHFSNTAAHFHDVANPRESAYWERALVAILLSAIFDALDGRAARLLRVTSKFGAVLDSLSDFVSFGVAPAMILHQWVLGTTINQPDSRIRAACGLLAVMTFAVCSALRLARFTSATPPPSPHKHASSYFVGMPTPAAAGAVLVPALLTASPNVNWPEHWPAPDWVIIAYTLLIAFLMISRVPMFSLKRIRVPRRLVAPILLLVVLLVVMMVFDPWMTIAAISGIYLISLPAAVVLHRRQRHAADSTHRDLAAAPGT